MTASSAADCRQRRIRTAAKELTGDKEHVRIGRTDVPKDLRLLSSQPIPSLDATGQEPFPGGTRLTWSDRCRRTWLTLDVLDRDAATEAWERVLAPEESTRIRRGRAAQRERHA